MFSRMYLEITTCCNLSCSFCPGTKRPAAFLSPENFYTLAAKLRPYGEHLYLHVMGEPLLHPDLPELLDIAGRMGFRVVLTTNGTLLPKRQRELLAAQALHKVSVSLHSFEANSGVDMEQHEAAVLDGATRFQRVIYLTLPAISGTIVTVFILNLAKVLNLFDPVWVLQNSMVVNTSDVLETYVYRMGISGSQYGLSTAAGLFKSVISILLVAIGNKLSKKLTGEEVL